MTEAEWLACTKSREMIAEIRSTTSERKMRLLAVAFCRLAWTYFREEPCRRAVEAAEEAADSPNPEPILEPVRASVNARHDETIRHLLHVSCIPELAAVILAHGGGYDAIAFIPNAPTPAHRTSVVRDIVGNPFRPVSPSPRWRTGTAVLLARQIYESREFSAMPILADALQDAGCDSADVLDHCRDPQGTHVRGCWVVDLVLEKE